ncbi:MAG TPA: VWA domain-containing protein [Candidatus Baltobacteraceae bacterium]|nr:VWA domain-containing protein [Candidatus Baltobacteraceae bacterium]
MSFAHPSYVVIAVTAALVFALLYRFADVRRRRQTLAYSNLPFLIGATAPRRWPHRTLYSAWIAAVALVVLALSGPHVRAAVPSLGGSVVLCVDTSGSMSAGDVNPTRAQAALAAMRAFSAEAPPQTSIGIISFATDAQVLTQPTRDRDQVQQALDAVPSPNGATAIGDALSLAQRILPRTGSRAVVLITDGENNAGSDPMQAAQALGIAHIRLFTIGIGTNSGALIPGTLQTAGIDEDALRAYAAATGGAYSRADDAVQLREALASLGRSTALTHANLDISLPVALAGATLMTITFLFGMIAGRYP